VVSSKNECCSTIVSFVCHQIGFAAADAITGLKLIEEGVPKETLALLGVPLVPIQIILPLIISKYTTGPNPMDIFLKAMPYRYRENMLVYRSTSCLSPPDPSKSCPKGIEA
jgi:hypothetical protein